MAPIRIKRSTLHRLEREIATEQREISHLQRDVEALKHPASRPTSTHRFIIFQQETHMALEGVGSTFSPDQTPVNDSLISGAQPATSQLVTSATNAQVGATGNIPTVQPGLVGLEPGSTGTLTLSLYDQSGNVVDYTTVAQLDTDGKTPIKPTWTSSDETNAPLKPSDDGMSVSITVPGNDTAGTPATITVTATLKNGTPATGAVTFPISAPKTYTFILAQS